MGVLAWWFGCGLGFRGLGWVEHVGPSIRICAWALGFLLVIHRAHMGLKEAASYFLGSMSGVLQNFVQEPHSDRLDLLLWRLSSAGLRCLHRGVDSQRSLQSQSQDTWSF